MTNTPLALLLAATLAGGALADPPKVPLFGRHKAATPAAALAAAPAPATAPADAAPAAPRRRPARPTRPSPPSTSRRPLPRSTPPRRRHPRLRRPTPRPLRPRRSLAAVGRVRVERLRAAYAYALPLYEMMRTRRLQVARTEALGAPGVNHLYARTTLADATTKDVTTPNNDTLYSSAWLDLSGGPVILDAPALPNRYHSVALMDLFTNNVAVLGTRNGGKGGRFLIVGPGWAGTPPAGMAVLRSPTNDAWLLVRLLVNGPDDLSVATGLIRGFSLEVPAENAKPVPTKAVPTTVPDAATFLAVVGEALARNPLPPGTRAAP